jgi:hypothetical protein
MVSTNVGFKVSWDMTIRAVAHGARCSLVLTPAIRLVPLLAAIALATLFACGDPYLHNNPYDPSDSVAITIAGPDTLFSYSELAQFTAQIVPAFPDSAVQWTTNDSAAFPPTGPATFRSNAPPLEPATSTVVVSARLGSIDTTVRQGTITVRTYAWRHVASKNVVLTQRVVRVQLRCPDTHACDTLAIGGTASVWADGFDALNHKIVSLTSATANPATGTAVATFAVRDPSVATVAPVGIRAATVTARSTGTTWIVATRGSLTESLAIIVGSTVLGPPAVHSVDITPLSEFASPGHTVAFTAHVNADAGVTDLGVTWSSSSLGVATVNADGVATALASGTATITATSDADSTKSASASLTVTTSVASINGTYTGPVGLTGIPAPGAIQLSPCSGASLGYAESILIAIDTTGSGTVTLTDSPSFPRQYTVTVPPALAFSSSGTFPFLGSPIPGWLSITVSGSTAAFVETLQYGSCTNSYGGTLRKQ